MFPPRLILKSGANIGCGDEAAKNATVVALIAAMFGGVDVQISSATGSACPHTSNKKLFCLITPVSCEF